MIAQIGRYRKAIHACDEALAIDPGHEKVPAFCAEPSMKQL